MCHYIFNIHATLFGSNYITVLLYYNVDSVVKCVFSHKPGKLETG